VITIADRHVDYANQVADKLRAQGFRTQVDNRNEKTGHKIREAQLQKIPYMLIVGDREAESGAVSLRSRSEGDKGAVALDELISSLKGELAPA
jgi:threonyl-tRNA synthetase